MHFRELRDIELPKLHRPQNSTVALSLEGGSTLGRDSEDFQDFLGKKWTTMIDISQKIISDSSKLPNIIIIYQLLPFLTYFGILQ